MLKTGRQMNFNAMQENWTKVHLAIQTTRLLAWNIMLTR